MKQRDESLSVLIEVLKKESVPGAYGPLDSDSLKPLVEAWTLGLTPGEARRRYGRNLERPQAP